MFASCWPFPRFSQNLQNSGVPRDVIFLRFEQFFTKFWIPGLAGLFWPLPGLFWPLRALFGTFLASSGPVLASSNSLLASSCPPLPGLFWLLPGPFLAEAAEMRGTPQKQQNNPFRNVRSPIQKRTDSQKAGMQCCLSSTTPATQSHRKPNPRKGQTHRKPTCIAACLSQFPPALKSIIFRLLQTPHPHNSGAGNSFRDSLHEIPPARPHRKPNPERDRLTESRHAVLLVFHNSGITASQKAQP